MKNILRSVVPRQIWNKLRVFKHRRATSRFNSYETQHTYGEVKLKVHIADPLAVGWYDRDGPELAEITFLKQRTLKPGARVFDLGAHQGVVALQFAHFVGPDGLVVAVEANSHNIQVARQNVSINDHPPVIIEHAAIAEKNGTLVFNEALNGSVDDGSGAWGQVEVQAITIDELARKYKNPDLIFLDVEGYEAKALQGGPKVLASNPDCFVEVHVGEKLASFGSTTKDVLSFFPKDRFNLFMAAQDDEQFVPFDASSDVLRTRFYLIAAGKR